MNLEGGPLTPRTAGRPTLTLRGDVELDLNATRRHSRGTAAAAVAVVDARVDGLPALPERTLGPALAARKAVPRPGALERQPRLSDARFD